MWSVGFRLRQYMKGSLWFVPLLGAVIGTLGAFAAVQLDEAVTLPESWQYSTATASALLSAIVGATAALTGFVVTVTVLVVQTVTGTFSPRYMRIWYRGRMLKASLTLLIGTLAFSFALLPRVETDFVPSVGVTIAGVLVILSLVLFLLFLDQCIHRLRPVAVVSLVAKEARRSFTAVTKETTNSPRSDELPAGPPAVVVRSDRAGAIQAVHADGLVSWASKHDCLLVLPHPVGDFVPAGEVLVEVYGARVRPRVAERRLGGMVALGVERTIEQDPAFAIRIMVDIACMALSPAVNAPTTAVQVLDHLEDVLRLIGTTHLVALSTLRDDQGRVRLIAPSPGWEQYLVLGVTEIRRYGASAVQVVKRLRALLETLDMVVRPDYRPAVEDELARLEATVEQHFGDAAERDRADLGDRQGLGGPALFEHGSARR